MKNFIKVFVHILIWAIILIVPTYIMSREGTLDNKPFISYTVRVLIFAIIFYVNYLYLIDKFLFNKKFVSYIIINIVLVGILFLAQSFFFELCFSQYPRVERIPRHHSRPPFAIRFISEYVLIFFVIGISVAIKTTVRWYHDSIKMEQVKNMQLEADLKILRTQLNPHFLFNTLNNIYSLIAIDQEKAQESVHRLSGLLRYVLYENDEKFLPISRELQFTQNYIDLMKLRLGKNTKLDVLIEDNESRGKIAPLMFITLIENAFKHGTNSAKESFIKITILVEAEKGVLCTVENSLDENIKNNNLEIKDSGVGLANLTKRLDLLYPGKHQFETELRQDSFFAMLRIDFSK
ncbi:sensor histidine kinase [Dysgonomonas sp. 520]|uniref:sensor histidine kinase n=1 Tax=Dysgonomonas sp. 520 TaxID=2302931 RepID=UPI0013D0B413|nr:histidine kinase [Dysgonomonas sp. 520]NDW08902.1 hypothetical protein [Dysgonomonas sp. 520]